MPHVDPDWISRKTARELLAREYKLWIWSIGEAEAALRAAIASGKVQLAVRIGNISEWVCIAADDLGFFWMLNPDLDFRLSLADLRVQISRQFAEPPAGTGSSGTPTAEQSAGDRTTGAPTRAPNPQRQSKTRGRKSIVRAAVEKAMRSAIQEGQYTVEALRDEKDDALAAEFKAKRTTARDARINVLSGLSQLGIRDK
jgi:hypothetical protein